jgi:hypothetical protein
MCSWLSEPSAEELAEQLSHSIGELSDGALQRLIGAVVRAYAARVEGSADRLPALADGAAVTATEVIVTVSGLLRAVDVAVFELGMWQALGRY